MFDTSLTTVTFSKMVDLLNRDWEKTAGNVSLGEASKLVMSENVPKGNGDRKRKTEYDTDTFASRKVESGYADKTRSGVGYEKDFIAVRFGKEFVISAEMRMWNKKDTVKADWASLKRFLPERRELDITHLITFANVTSYVDKDGYTVDATTGDGLELAHASHTLTNSTDTYSSIISGAPAFSRTALETAEQAMATQIKNNFGDKRRKKFDKIFCSDTNPTAINTIMEFLNSTASVADNKSSGVKNIYKDKYTLCVLPYLATTPQGIYDATKSNWWGIIAQNGNPADSWQAYILTFEDDHTTTPREERNDDWVWGVRGAWAVGALSARGFMISLAT